MGWLGRRVMAIGLWHIRTVQKITPAISIQGIALNMQRDKWRIGGTRVIMFKQGYIKVCTSGLRATSPLCTPQDPHISRALNLQMYEGKHGRDRDHQ